MGSAAVLALAALRLPPFALSLFTLVQTSPGAALAVPARMRDCHIILSTYSGGYLGGLPWS